MGFWRHIASYFRRENTATDAPANAPRMGGVSLFASDHTAMNIATVYRCVKLLSESVANLPMQYMKRRGGIFVEDTSDRLHYLLNVQPDYSYNAFEFWRQVVQNVLMDGNAYIVPVYNAASMGVDRLVLCGRGTVSHDTTNDTYDIFDMVNGIQGRYAEDEVIHIKGLTGTNGKVGVSVLAFARLTMSIAATGDQETQNRFANGGNVRGIVSNDSSLRGFGEYRDEQLKSTAEDLNARFSNGERIVNLPGQVDFKQISLSSTDMQFLESRKFTVREICRFFGVHPSFVFDDTSNNYKSAEMANVAFLANTLNPLLRCIEIELHRKLVAPEYCCRYKFQFDRRGLYACDLDSQIKYQAQTIAAGLYTVNDWRREMNKPPVEGGDVVLVSANLRNITEPTATATAEPAEPKENHDNDNKDNNDNEEE